ncbi:hypothetical protein KK062_30460, partial [Fulvivirgaceae bacterium PWU5]|nr:hypothetical protein [Dawidia cretensis]
GVVRDFHTQALDHAIEPVVLYNDKGSYKNLSMKISTVNMQATLEYVQRKWEATYPEYTFHYAFMDQQIAEMYGGERKTAAMLNVFSG